MKRGRLKKLNRQTIAVHAKFNKFSWHKYKGTRTALLEDIHRAADQRYLCDHHWLPAERFWRCQKGDIVRFRATVRKMRDGFYLANPYKIRVLQERRYGHRD